MSRHLSTRNISLKSMHVFLSNLANRQTDRQTNKQTRTKTCTSSFVRGKWHQLDSNNSEWNISYRIVSYRIVSFNICCLPTISSLKITDRSFKYASSLESTPRFISSASPVLSRLTSSSTCQPISLIIPTLVIHHSFTLSLQAQNLPFQQILPTLDFFCLLNCLHDNGTAPDTKLISLFLVSHYNFLFIPSIFLVHVKYTLSHRIVCPTFSTVLEDM